MDFNLEYILKRVASGTLSVKKAKEIIEDHIQNIQEDHLIFPKKIVTDALRRSTEFVSQVSEGLQSFDKLQEIILENTIKIKKSNSSNGFDSKFSLINNMTIEPESFLSGNMAIGSQIKDLIIAKSSTLTGCKMTASQFSEMSILASQLISTQFTLTRCDKVLFEDTFLEHNSISRGTFLDTTITHSKWNSIKIVKSTFKESNFHKSTFKHIKFRDCFFEGMTTTDLTLTGIEFIDCSFRNCQISNVHIICENPVQVSGKTFDNRQIFAIHTLEDLLSIG